MIVGGVVVGVDTIEDSVRTSRQWHSLPNQNRRPPPMPSLKTN
jgi:hypothetical protein